MEVNLEDDALEVSSVIDNRVDKKSRPVRQEAKSNDKPLTNCLKNEKVAVKFIPKEGGLVTDPKHILYGGMGVNSHRKIVVPLLSTGVYKNVLTNDEKDYLEYAMGLPENALSVYKRDDNFWENRGVICGKETFTIDLSTPQGYIDYKILMANDDLICPSEEQLKKQRKATYQFVLIKEGSEDNEAFDKLKTAQKAMKLFETLESDLEKLTYVVEATSGRSIARGASLKDIAPMVETVIRDTPKKFIDTAEDPYLETKVLINRGVNSGVIRKRNTYYYLAETNQPLCTDKQEPTLQNACDYINAPKNQEILFLIQAKTKK